MFIGEAKELLSSNYGFSLAGKVSPHINKNNVRDDRAGVNEGVLKIELKPASRSADCKRSMPCEVKVVITKTSESEVRLTGISFLFQPYSQTSKISAAKGFGSGVNLVNWEPMKPGEAAQFVTLPSEGPMEKTVDLGKLIWTNLLSSALQAKSLSKIAPVGKYQLHAEVAFRSELMPESEQPYVIGNSEVKLQDRNAISSNIALIKIRK